MYVYALNMSMSVCVFTVNHSSDQVWCWGHVSLSSIGIAVTDAEVHSLATACCHFSLLPTSLSTSWFSKVMNRVFCLL